MELPLLTQKSGDDVWEFTTTEASDAAVPIRFEHREDGARCTFGEMS